ncbi:hypothetical protein LNQ81_16425 [Myroides sp. M-43]|uniref:hypothetical protein n=1 Tax=Myroides oncorhynchi TaxID=2893756 RepID=UPI001E37D8AE|nr:hypothetical protein [Myroides oncorhynchi]MCC9044259.1 hypothetical protein [Myroides oncorhynchi]
MNTSHKPDIYHYLLAFVFILLMVVVATYFQDPEIVLPEVAALAVGLWVFQEKAWLRQPDKIFILPSLTALMGFGLNMLALPYIVKIVVILVLMLLVIRVVNYSLPPALATGFLPIVTNAHAWSFIYAILVTTFVLMIVVYVLKLNKGIDPKGKVNTKMMYPYVLISLVWIVIAYYTGNEQMAVIPPIAVVLYESLNMKMYSLKIAVKQVAILTLAIGIGVLLYQFIEHWLVLASLFMVLMYGLSQLFKIRVPAVYAFPFLVYVFPAEKVLNLPIATFVVATFSFGAVYVFRAYVQPRLVTQSKVNG